MSLPARTPGGLRPACADLPPTLLPHAILAVAPTPDRGRSLLAAGAVYVALGAGALFFSRNLPVMRRPVPPTCSEPIDLQTDPGTRPPQPPPLPARPAVHANPPADPMPAQQTSDVPPEGKPQPLTGEDHSKDGVRAATPDEMRRGSVQVPPTSPVASRPGTPAVQPVHDFAAAPPRVVVAAQPSYPELARRAHLQGPVQLRMTVDERGVPVQVEVLSGHPAFHAEAERAARLWRFEPARLDGEPVAARFHLTLLFRLQ